MKKIIIIAFLSLTFHFFSNGQIVPTKDQMNFYSSEWKGERFPDGRPKVSDDLVKRLKNISIEEAWGVLRNEGYHNQFERGWKILHEDEPFVGRALTAVYFPKRPDVAKKINEKGKEEGRIGGENSWPIDMLKEGDVYVADCFGKIEDGTLIGDNLGNSIFAKSKTGVIFDAGARDIEGLEAIKGFNAFVRDWDPSYLQETMLMGINVPIRIGKAVVMPGDLVLAKKEGVVFIPAHLAEKVIINSEFVALKDRFGHEMLRKGTYTPGQIDSKWSDDIKNAFIKWISTNEKDLPMSKKELDDFMKNRTW